jgi:WD40 repeat protein
MTRVSKRLFVLLGCLVALTATVTAGEHHTLRFVYSSGTKQHVRSMAFSPDGAELAVCTSNGEISFIRTLNGETTGRFKSSPFSMAYSRDGKRLFMISTRGSHLLDVAKGRPIPFETKQEPGYVGIRIEQRNGKLLISQVQPGGPVALSGSIQVGDELIAVGQAKGGGWNGLIGSSVQQGLKLLRGPAGTHLRLKIVPRGELRPLVYTYTRQPKRLVDGMPTFIDYEGESVRENVVWCVQEDRHTFIEASAGRTVASVQTEAIENVGQYAISPNSSKFAVIAHVRDSKDTAIEVFDIAMQRREKLIAFPELSWLTLAFSGDSSKLLIGTWYTVEVLDWQTGEFSEPITIGEPPAPQVEKLDGTGGAAAGAVIRSAARRQGPFYYQPRRHVECLAASSLGHVAVGNRGVVRLFTLDGGEELRTLDAFTEEPIEQLMFSPDGRWVAYFCDGVLHIVDVSDLERGVEVAAK